MTASAPEWFDPDGLDVALAAVNAARTRRLDDPRRVAESLRGLEELLAAAAPAGPVRPPLSDSALAELDELLVGAGEPDGASLVRSYLAPIAERLIETILDRPEERLAAYGSLRPGEKNHAQLSTLVGEWRGGTVWGRLDSRGWGATLGYPGFVPDATAGPVTVGVFMSRALPAHWSRLDEFEGPGYQRVLVPVEMDGRMTVCNLYEVRIGPESESETPDRVRGPA